MIDYAYAVGERVQRVLLPYYTGVILERRERAWVGSAEYRVDWEEHGHGHEPSSWFHEGEIRLAPYNPFSPFNRSDPRNYRITVQDAELSAQPPQKLKIVHPVTIEETRHAVVAELTRMELTPNSVLTIIMQDDCTFNQLRDIREHVLAVLPEGVWVLVLPPSRLAVLDMADTTDEQPFQWTGNEDER